MNSDPQQSLRTKGPTGINPTKTIEYNDIEGVEKSLRDSNILPKRKDN